MKKRLAFYVFWEKEGIVRDYVSYYLEELKKVAEDILVIANGGMNKEGISKLENIGVEVFERENHGIDFGAWKAAFEHRGWDEVCNYDEVILCNCSTYGPVFPFQEMFDEMEKRPCDFWGISKHPAKQKFFIPDNPESLILEHVQSYFLVLNKNVVNSLPFRDWWENLVQTDKYEEEVGLHETKFTGYLEKSGFKSGSYIDIEKYKQIVHDGDVVRLFPADILVQDRVPLVKRKVLMENYDLKKSGYKFSVLDIIPFIKNNTEYPVSYIEEDLSLKLIEYNKNLDDLAGMNPDASFLKYKVLSKIAFGNSRNDIRKKYSDIKTTRRRIMNLKSILGQF